MRALSGTLLRKSLSSRGAERGSGADPTAGKTDCSAESEDKERKTAGTADETETRDYEVGGAIMSWADVGQIATAAIISAGGIGAIIVAVICFSTNWIADRLAKKFEAKLAQEMEKYKIELSKKEYVSKTRFDTEFKIYRDLSIVFLI